MKERLHTLARTAPSPRFVRFEQRLRARGRDALSLDRVLNELMTLFRQTRSVEAYTLLYHLTWRSFLVEITGTLRRYGSRCDPWDVLQDVYLCIYRYPDRFRPEKERAFRNWGKAVVRNAVRKHLKKNHRWGAARSLPEELSAPPGAGDPLREAMEKEGRQRLRRTYLLTLSLYLAAYHHRLKPRERKALHLVEVEGLSYRTAAKRLGIKAENFKMVVCRARRKIFNAFGKPSPPVLRSRRGTL